MKSNKSLVQIAQKNLITCGPGRIRTFDQAIMSRLR
jgi:hypothetical protein